ncbi:10 kda heat shock protein [Anaeramoeba flamelloides]|uniref:10 kDa heat shock protein n=1 Tax=Anaeramoeba flamelloides TaxID=1746091 RepID=A0ABQ8Z1V9_9EUKA|nr:10 kda heat shock protein [Anaeramoeba flamelloides]
MLSLSKLFSQNTKKFIQLTACSFGTRVKDLIPLYERIIVERKETKTKTKSGIVLPDSASKKNQRATVLSVGDGLIDKNGKRFKPTVKVGDTIILPKFGGVNVHLEDKDVIIIKESDIMGVVSKN